MRFLIVNDDGVDSEGIARLAKAAKHFGEVAVVAPAHQCSGMSMRLTIFNDMELREYPFPVDGVRAWSLDGSPADCVKMAMNHILDFRPDWIFSGINRGYNAGRDVLYSGTMGAATEGLLWGIPSAAFSTAMWDNYEVVDAWLLPVMQEILSEPVDLAAVWNVNFPQCALKELQGIVRGARPATIQLYSDSVQVTHCPNGKVMLRQLGVPCRAEDAESDSDIRAVLTNHIAIGKVYNAVTLRNI